ncbi:hypothetical protein Lal_00018405 [Lupinus albus]|uniref:Uncharacterized protein n=1 Tax=Lupinus albus TaxID=3870 RepID=A0A6A4QPQ2_LUPAL|nr:hypothetical protein Lalb_Chr04g0255771 [Lupinus albus]KAF1869312.1 hypothetical protein Lal_00018405 [Lupinus albus]
MKISFSSTTLIIFILFLFFFFSATNSVAPSNALSLINPSITSNNHNHKHLGYCDSFSRKNPRSLCIELQNMHQRMQTPVPPSNESGIDPRYGEEKRVVPSGPNPLHN